MFSCMVVRLDGLNLNLQNLDILNHNGLQGHQMSSEATFNTSQYLYSILTLTWNVTDNV